MPQHCIDTLLKRETGLELAVEVCFDYHFLPPSLQWLDKSLGYLQIKFIKNQATGASLIDLSLDEHLQLKRACWDSLKKRLF